METKRNAPNRKILLAVAALVVAVLVLAAAYFAFAPKGAGGEKTITVDVVLLDGSDTQTTITTSEEFLRGAYGLFVTTVNGVTADDSKEQWWCITKGGEMVSTGVDTTPIADGDAFEITLTEGY